MEPYSLLLSILTLLIYSSLLSHFGKQNIIQSIWLIYLKYSSNPKLKQLNKLKTTKKAVFLEKSSISPQDQYAKWTKLNRKFDELNKSIDSLELEIVEFKQNFEKPISLLLSSIYWLPMVWFRIFNRKVGVFWLPNGGFPYYLEKLLSWPSAPIGSIGLSQWCFLINAFLSGVLFIIKNFNVELPEKPTNKITTVE